MMRYSNIKYLDIANGPGCRTSLFVSGCRNHCKGCFNEDTWSFDNGIEFTKETLNDILKKTNNSNVAGLSILGGEPLEPENQKDILKLIKKFKKKFPNKTVWLWTGFEFERIASDPSCRACTQTVLKIFDLIDVLVDGPFVQEKKELLRFRGSSNQRIINMKKTWQGNHIYLWEDEFIYSSHSWTD